MKNDPNKNGMTYASHTLPSLHLFTPHQLTAPPNTHCMSITYPFIIIHAIHKSPYHSIHSSTIAPHAPIQSPCSVTIVMAPSSLSNNQNSIKLQSNASAKQPTAISEPDVSLPHTSRPPHATACSFHTYFHIITTCLICYMMH